MLSSETSLIRVSPFLSVVLVLPPSIVHDDVQFVDCSVSSSSSRKRLIPQSLDDLPDDDSLHNILTVDISRDSDELIWTTK